MPYLRLEIIIDPKYDHRLLWPYGDHMPGSYLSKISLQVYCVILVIFFNRVYLKCFSWDNCFFELVNDISNWRKNEFYS